jgi:flavin-dependent dehydrogenase
MNRPSPAHDVIVIGGGPGGSTAATLLARKGFSVLLVEREQFPRFQIGESLLPYNNDLFDRLGISSRFPENAYFAKHGAQFVTADESAGHTFRFGRHLPERYSRAVQVRRADFDCALLRNAAKAGVEVRELTRATDIDLDDPDRVTVTLTSRSGETSTVQARFVIDASGHGAELARKLRGKIEEPSLKKIATFAHYRGMTGREPGLDAGNTVIVLLKDGWFWSIPLSEDLTSVGLVVDRDVMLRSKLSPEAFLEKMLGEAPYFATRMAQAERVSPIYTRKDFSYRVSPVAGRNFCLVGDAAGFFDPIFSTGVFMAMKTADIASEAVEARLRSGSMTLLKRYSKSVDLALRRYFSFITRFYQREFLEVFLHPSPRFGLLPVIVGVLAGDVFERKRDRWRLALFFLLTSIQRRRPVIAPRIPWDTLPTAGGLLTSEESLV